MICFYVVVQVFSISDLIACFLGRAVEGKPLVSNLYLKDTGIYMYVFVLTLTEGLLMGVLVPGCRGGVRIRRLS